jgi:hypothetical protein
VAEGERGERERERGKEGERERGRERERERGREGERERDCILFTSVVQISSSS